MPPPRAGLNRAAVIEAAAEVADRDGFDEVSLKAIASAVNVQPPSLYNHVDGLEDVRGGLRLRAFELLQERQRRAVEGRPVEEWLPLLAEVHRGFAGEHPGLYASTHPTAHRRDEDPEVQRAAQAILDDLVAAVAPYGLADDDAVHAVRAFRSLVVGFNSLESAGHFGIPVDVDESFRFVVGLLMTGLRKDD